jgi:hypothetical protein
MIAEIMVYLEKAVLHLSEWRIYKWSYQHVLTCKNWFATHEKMTPLIDIKVNSIVKSQAISEVNARKILRNSLKCLVVVVPSPAAL